MSETSLQLWVAIAARGELEQLRKAGIRPMIVTEAGGTPLYGRPGESICIRFEANPPANGAQRALGALPLRAGLLVRADADGLAFLDLARARGRHPLAVSVAGRDDVRLALAHRAEVLVVFGVDGVASAREAAGGATIVAEVLDADAAARAIRAGANGLLVSAGLALVLAARPELAGRVIAERAPEATPRAGGRSHGGARTASATIGAAVERAAARHADRTALVHLADDRRLTYAEVRTEVRAAARALLAAGVGHGDRVALSARNVVEWPVIQFAAGTIGAVIVAIAPSASEDELRFVLEQSRSVVLIAAARTGGHGAGVHALAAIERSRPADLRHVVELGAAGGAGTTAESMAGIESWAAFLRAGETIRDADLDRAAGAPRPDDTALILYTSGTTGSPKGATLSHRAVLQNAAAVGGNLHLGSADRLCLPVPFHHCFGSVMGSLAALWFGASLVLPNDWFDAARTLDAIAAERCTVLYGVPTMFTAELEANRAAPRDLGSLRTGIISGAPVSEVLAHRVAAELHLPQLVVAYGLTEAAPVVTQTRVDEPPAVRLGTVGRAIVGAEVRAVNPATGRTAAIGEPGELLTRGPMVMQGYFEDPAGTAAAIDANGWLHTGDLATRDASGHWQIVGRLKDMIIRGGENLYPAEIESVLRRHPGVADAQVVGVPSDYYGEEAIAFIQVRPGLGADPDTIRAFATAHLAANKVPREIRVIDAFPLTGSGKVIKGRLRELAGSSAASGSGSGASGAGTGATAATTGGGAGIGLPLLPIKTLARDEVASPTDDDPSKPGRLPSRPPRRGWQRPERGSWAWKSESNPSSPEEDSVTADIRRRGRRIKTWGIGDNVQAQIEATGESPIMYKALGTPVQSSHPFNLYGDIRSQPEALKGTFESGAEIEQVARQMAERNITGIVGLGSGTSQFVAQVANAAFARYAGIPAWDYDSMAFLRYPPPFDWSKTAVMGYSGSGSTVDTVAATRGCHEQGAFTVAFTSVEGSPVVQASDARILTAGGFDTGGSDTFHYTTRVAAAIYLALELGRLRRPGAYDYDDLKRQLLDTPRQMAEMFDMVDARCQTIAEQYMNMRSILVVGGGPNYGTAEEIALKFDEMAHIPTKGMSPGRHIHGALGLTDSDILTILVAPPGSSYDDVLSIAKVTQLLKTPAVAIVTEDDKQISEICDYVIRLPARDEMIFPVLAVLPGQLIPYWSGVGLGLNPDTQRSNVPKHARAWNMLFPPGTH